jgi:excisionase family DNA binding protein
MTVRNSRDGSEAVPPARLMKVADAAESLSVGRRTIWRLIAAGRLRSVKIGRAVRIDRESVEQVILSGAN